MQMPLFRHIFLRKSQYPQPLCRKCSNLFLYRVLLFFCTLLHSRCHVNITASREQHIRRSFRQQPIGIAYFVQRRHHLTFGIKRKFLQPRILTANYRFCHSPFSAKIQQCCFRRISQRFITMIYSIIAEYTHFYQPLHVSVPNCRICIYCLL